MSVLHHALFGLTVVALASASLRAATCIAPAGLDRLLCAAVLAVTAAVSLALVLGLVGLGASPLALSAATLLLWLAAHRRLPPPALGAAAEIAAWWAERRAAERAALAALAGAGLAFVAWLLRHPAIGFDGTTYHFAEVAGWIHSGHPGTVLRLSYDLPYGNYPVTDEVAQTFWAGITRSFVPLSLWNPLLYLLMGLSTWHLLRSLALDAATALLGTAAVLALPLIVHQLAEPQNDLTAMSWLATTAALAVRTGRRPALLGPTILAAALAVGTKTTPAIPVLAMLGVALVGARGTLRAQGPRLAGALALAILVGGVWYLRNLIDHGSPLWPFGAAPWGDPMPRFLKVTGASLIAHAGQAVRENRETYLHGVAGGIVLLVGTPVALLVGAIGLRGRAGLRPLLVAAGLTAVALIVFAASPGTGPARSGFWFGPASTLRYLLPTLGCAAIAVALAARAGPVPRLVAGAALAGSLVWSLLEDRRYGFPIVPRVGTLLLGALAGVVAWAAATLAVHAIKRRPRLPVPLARALPWAAAVLAGAALTPIGSGYIARHGRVDRSTALGREVAAWFAARPDFATSHEPIGFVSRAVIATLAGDHFTHPLYLLPRTSSCAAIRAAAHRGPVVVTQPGFLSHFIGIEPYATAGCLAGAPVSYRDPIFTVYRFNVSSGRSTR